MSAITILLVAIVALLAGMEGILDEFQFHQPLVACTLIGLVTGHLQEGILLGGSLQMMALGWANVGAAVAPDAALASVASSIIMVLALNGGATDSGKAVTAAIAVAAIAFGYLREANDKEAEMQYLEQPADPQPATDTGAATPEQPITE
mgnify:CR=1 FL=1